MPAFSGKQARVSVNGINLPANKWTVNLKTDELDVTTFENGGFANFTYGVHEADVSFEAFWTTLVNPTSNPPKIQIGADVPCIIYLDSGLVSTANTSFTFNFPHLLITSLSVDTSVRDVVKYSVSGKARGNFSATASGTSIDNLPDVT